MATAIIVIRQNDLNITPGSRDNLILNVPVTLFNLNNTGVTSFLWQMIDRPNDSIAVLSGQTSAMATFIPDVEGTYLVKLIINGGQATDKKGAAVKTANLHYRIPAATEDSEFDTIRGWATAVNDVLVKVDDGYGGLLHAAKPITVDGTIKSYAFVDCSTIGDGFYDPWLIATSVGSVGNTLDFQLSYEPSLPIPAWIEQTGTSLIAHFSSATVISLNNQIDGLVNGDVFTASLLSGGVDAVPAVAASWGLIPVFLADPPGAAGNNISLTLVADSVSGFTISIVSGTQLTGHYEDGVSTLQDFANAIHNLTGADRVVIVNDADLEIYIGQPLNTVILSVVGGWPNGPTPFDSFSGGIDANPGARASIKCFEISFFATGNNHHFDTAIEAVDVGIAGDSISITLVGANPSGVSITRIGSDFTLHYQDDVSTVASIEAAITALTGSDKLIQVKTPGTGPRILSSLDRTIMLVDPEHQGSIGGGPSPTMSGSAFLHDGSDNNTLPSSEVGDPIIIGQKIEFSATVENSQGDVIYHWLFGDSTTSPTGTTDAVVSHRYSTPGYFQPVILVTDDSDIQASRIFIVTVAGSLPPVATGPGFYYPEDFGTLGTGDDGPVLQAMFDQFLLDGQNGVICLLNKITKQALDLKVITPVACYITNSFGNMKIIGGGSRISGKDTGASALPAIEIRGVTTDGNKFLYKVTIEDILAADPSGGPMINDSLFKIHYVDLSLIRPTCIMSAGIAFDLQKYHSILIQDISFDAGVGTANMIKFSLGLIPSAVLFSSGVSRGGTTGARLITSAGGGQSTFITLLNVTASGETGKLDGLHTSNSVNLLNSLTFQTTSSSAGVGHMSSGFPRSSEIDIMSTNNTVSASGVFVMLDPDPAHAGEYLVTSAGTNANKVEGVGGIPINSTDGNFVRFFTLGVPTNITRDIGYTPVAGDYVKPSPNIGQEGTAVKALPGEYYAGRVLYPLSPNLSSFTLIALEQGITPGAIQAWFPQSYGAVGDGVADDSPAFQTMLSAIALAGSSADIYLSSTAGVFTYNLATAVSVDLSKLAGHLRFIGGGSTIRCGLGSMELLNSIGDGLQFTVEFDGVLFRSNSAAVFGIHTDKCALRVVNCSAGGFSGSMIKASDSGIVVVDGFTGDMAGLIGIWFELTNSLVSFPEATFRNISTTSLNTGGERLVKISTGWHMTRFENVICNGETSILDQVISGGVILDNRATTSTTPRLSTLTGGPTDAVSKGTLHDSYLGFVSTAGTIPQFSAIVWDSSDSGRYKVAPISTAAENVVGFLDSLGTDADAGSTTPIGFWRRLGDRGTVSKEAGTAWTAGDKLKPSRITAGALTKAIAGESYCAVAQLNATSGATTGIVLRAVGITPNAVVGFAAPASTLPNGVISTNESLLCEQTAITIALFSGGTSPEQLWSDIPMPNRITTDLLNGKASVVGFTTILVDATLLPGTPGSTLTVEVSDGVGGWIALTTPIPIDDAANVQMKGIPGFLGAYADMPARVTRTDTTAAINIALYGYRRDFP